MTSIDLALDISRTILAGFNTHYRIFRDANAAARGFFERQEWTALRQNNRDRNDMYNVRVLETVETLRQEFPNFDEALWPQIKKDYISLLYEHHQPELAETFFNSVSVKVLHRRYLHNEYVFSRPAVSADHIEGKQPTYRCYYPMTEGIQRTILHIFEDFKLGVPLTDPRKATRDLVRAFRTWMPEGEKVEPNFHIQVLSSLFYRNKAAYAIGRIVNGHRRALFAIALCHAPEGGLYVDAFIHERDQLANLMSVAHAYFMVDMEVPSSWISFIRTALPEKPRAELYTSVGLQRQGKILFVRDLRQHLKHSADRFVVAPGIRGMVMCVFTLPSFPFVFKVIRDSFEPPKDTSREQVMEKYRLVKLHDRIGRLADTLEYFDMALPLDRFSPDLLEHMKRLIPSQLEFEQGYVIVKHVYIEHRMTPLNIYLDEASEKGDEQKLKHGVHEYGQALRDLAMANIFPGDLLLKNFGVNPYGRVLFYDYDEVCYLTECRFRKIPEPHHVEDETRSEPWYGLGPNDVFPEEFGRFLFKSDSRTRELFTEVHGDLLTPEFWKKAQENIRNGIEPDFFPYPESVRFKRSCSTPDPSLDLIHGTAREGSAGL